MKSQMPLYRAVMDELIQQIESKPEGVTHQLPTENELCQRYGVSRITVRRALSELVAQGLVYRVQGKGTYVLPRKERVVPAESIYRQFAGLKGKHVNIGCSVIPVPDKFASLLSVDKGEVVVCVARRKVMDRIPLIYERAYVSARKLPDGWLRSDFDRDELFLDMFSRYGLRPKMSRILLNAAMADDDESKYLELDDRAPVLRLNRVALDPDEKPLWVVANTMRSDMGSYVMEVNVPDPGGD